MADINKDLDLDTLKRLSPLNKIGTDVVTEAARELFLNCIKTESNVHDVFFEETSEHPLRQYVERRLFPFHKFSVLFVANALLKVKDAYKFHSMVKKDKIQDDLRALYESIQWKKIGFQIYTLLYPTVVKDGNKTITLDDYIQDDGHVWAERLVAEITSPDWMKGILCQLIKGRYTEEEYNRDMNILFVKLHLLDPQSVIPAYQYLLSCRALPAVNLELATRNYLGGPLDWKMIKPEVEGAVNRESLPLNVSRLSLDELDIYYGIQVDDFVVTECQTQGLWTGTRPDNRRTSKFRDRCYVM